MANAIWTPDGVRVLDAKVRERVELSPSQALRLTQFADVAKAFDLGIHCTLCEADLLGKNATSDRVYSISCGCRDLMWPALRSVEAIGDVFGWLKSFEAMTKTMRIQMHCGRCFGDAKQALSSDDRTYGLACLCRELKPKLGKVKES